MALEKISVVDIIFLLIPLSMLLIALVIHLFLWAVRSGQFEDLDGPAHRILLDDDSIKPEDRAAKDEC